MDIFGRIEDTTISFWYFLTFKDGDKNLSLKSALLKLGTSAVFSTPLMVLQMAFFQFISGDIQGLPTAQSMVACISAYSLLIYSLPL